MSPVRVERYIYLVDNQSIQLSMVVEIVQPCEKVFDLQSLRGDWIGILVRASTATRATGYMTGPTIQNLKVRILRVQFCKYLGPETSALNI